MTTPIDQALASLNAMSPPVSSGSMGSLEDFAQFLATSRRNTRPKPIISLPTPKKKSSPSILSRVIDVLSRPLYTVTSTINEGVDPEPSDNFKDFVEAAWGGFSGKRKTMPGDIWISGRQRIHGETKEEATRQINKADPFSRFMMELGPAILLDPLSYLGVGLFTKPKHAGSAAVEAGKGASKADVLADKLPKMNKDDVLNTPYVATIGLDGSRTMGTRAPKDYGRGTTAEAFSTNLSRKAAYSGPEPAAAVGLQDIPATFRRGPSVPEATPPVSTFDVPNVQPPVSPVRPPGMIKTLSDAEISFRNLYQADLPPKIARAQDINYAEDLAKQAGYANRESAARAGRREAAAVPKATESPYVTAMREANPKTAAGLPLPRNANDLIAGIARGDMNFIQSAAPRFVPSARQAVRATHVNKANELLQKAKIIGTAENAAVFNRAAQTNLFDKAFGYARRVVEMTEAKARTYAYNVLRAAEQAEGVAIAGYGGKANTTMSQIINDLGGPNSPLLRGEGTHNLLTKVARAFDTGDLKILDGAPQAFRDAVQAAMARNAVAEAPSLARIVENAAHDMDIARKSMSAEKFDAFMKRNVVADIAKGQRDAKVGLRPRNQTGAASQSPTTFQAARQLVSAANKARKSRPQQEMDLWIKDGWLNRVRDGKALYNTKPKDYAAFQEAQSRLIEKELGVSFKNLGEEVGASNRAWDTIMARVSTHHGQQDIRQLFQTEFGFGQAQAATKAEYLNDLVRGNPAKGIPASTEAQRSEAFKLVQGLGDSAAVSPEVQALAGRFEQLMGLMLDSNQMNSIATRALVSKKQLNSVLAQMGSKFKFDSGKDVKDTLGVSHDFSKGMDWLNSWKAADIADPVEFMYKMDHAMEIISHKNAALDDFIARWGSAKYGGEYTSKVPSVERANGFYFPKDMAQQLANFEKSQEKMFAATSPFMQHLDKALTAWKSGVTIYAPSHHIRNMIGDTYFNWMNGVNTIKPYRDAARIMGANSSKYEDFAGLELLSMDNPLKTLAQTTRGGDTILTTRGGLSLTADQLYLGARSKGILQKARVAEELIGDPLLKNGLPLIRGRGQKAARKVSETRDHYARLAHFADIMRKSNVSSLKGLDEAMNQAAARVRKWHPDGMDLTHAEKTVARRVIPFYSWARKSIPLILESMVKKPGKTLAFPKAMYALGTALGMEPDSIADPFPTDQLFPDWIKAKGIGPIALYGAQGPAGALAGLTAGAAEYQFDPNTGQIVEGPMGYGVINPSNPFLDFFGTYASKPQDPVQGAFQGVMQGMTPFIKSPIELAQGRQFLTGAPIEDASRYTTENLPIVSILSRLSGMDISGEPTRRAERGDINYQKEAWANFLFALGATGTGPYIKNTEIAQNVR